MAGGILALHRPLDAPEHKGSAVVINITSPLQGSYEWCTLMGGEGNADAPYRQPYDYKRRDGIGLGGLAAAPTYAESQEILAGWAEGSAILGRTYRDAAGRCGFLTRDVAQPAPDNLSSDLEPWAFARTTPQDNSARSNGDLVAFSPNYGADGVILGARPRVLPPRLRQSLTRLGEFW